jgi:hypothetical protein
MLRFVTRPGRGKSKQEVRDKLKDLHGQLAKLVPLSGEK